MPAIDFKALLRTELAAARATAATAESTENASSTSSASAPFPNGLVDTRSAPLTPHDARSLGGVRGLAYVSDFMGPRDAEALERALTESSPSAWWTAATGDGRRVFNAGGTSPSSQFKGEEDLKRVPGYLRVIMERLREVGAMRDAPNHVLANEYCVDGGIEPHSDGHCYARDVCIVTLRGGALIEFWPRQGAVTREGEDAPGGPRPVASVLLEPGSLLMYSDDAYELRHGIRRNRVDVLTDATANVDSRRVGERVHRNPKGRVSVVFVCKK